MGRRLSQTSAKTRTQIHSQNSRNYAEYNWNKKSPRERFNLMVGGYYSDEYYAKLSKKSWKDLSEKEKSKVIHHFTFDKRVIR